MKDFSDRVVDRVPPPDFRHIEKYPLLAIDVPDRVEIRLLSRFSVAWRKYYDQGNEGACVGFAASQCMTFLNRVRYDARWLYHEAQKVDYWPGEDYEGTWVSAAMDVLRDRGHVRVYRGSPRPEDAHHGINANRWATTVDEIRACLALKIPVVLGVNWYPEFDRPLLHNKEWWIAPDVPTITSRARGGHAICLMDASDERQAVRFPNSWGIAYPPSWMRYSVLEQLLKEDGEATIITDR